MESLFPQFSMRIIDREFKTKHCENNFTKIAELLFHQVLQPKDIILFSVSVNLDDENAIESILTKMLTYRSPK